MQLLGSINNIKISERIPIGSMAHLRPDLTEIFQSKAFKNYYLRYVI